jgi:hypothetical protein
MSLKQVDKFTYTSAVSGTKEDVEWKFFDVDLIKSEVRQHIVNHHTMERALHEMPRAHQFQFWYEFMYSSEKLIANWKGLEQDFPQYKFDVTTIDIWNIYHPFMSDEVLLATNKMSDYDELGFTFTQALNNIKHFLQDNFDDVFTTPDMNIVIQAQVWDMLDKCLSNMNYKLTQEEVEYNSLLNYPIQSTRWVEKKLSAIGHTRDSYFRQFEIVLQNGMQPTYKLCSPFNAQLHTLPYSAYTIYRGSGLQSGIHFQVLVKFKMMFLDWFRKKHKGELTIDVVIAHKQEHLIVMKTEEHNIIDFETYPEETDINEGSLPEDSEEQYKIDKSMKWINKKFPSEDF